MLIAWSVAITTALDHTTVDCGATFEGTQTEVEAAGKGLAS